MKSVSINKIVYEIYFWTRRHPFYSSLILFLPNAYFTILQICPEKVNLKVSNEITGLGIFLFWILLIISFLLILGKGLIDTYVNQIVADNAGRQKELMSSSMQLVTLKKERFVKYIQNNINTNNCMVFSEITDPESQLEALCNHIRNSLSRLSRIDEHQIGVSIFARDQNKWKMIIKSNVGLSASVQKLMDDNEAACFNAINSDSGLVFYPDKRVGEQEKKYRMTRKDNENKGIGSILSKDISIIIEDNVIFSAILNISTYGQPVCSQADEMAKEKIIKDILPSYVDRAQLELSLLYIKKYIFRKGANCPNKKPVVRKPRQNTNKQNP